MKLSHSIHKGIMETAVGSLVNKFKIKRRRDILFFDDITIKYLKECDNSGYFDDIRLIVKKWMQIYGKVLFPLIFKKMPPVFFFNNIFRIVWINLGYLEDIHLRKQGKYLFMKTKNERYLKQLGVNSFTIGGFQGVLSVIFNSNVKYLNVKRKGNNCEYKFEITKDKLEILNKSKDHYFKINKFTPKKGFTLKDALKFKIFQVKNNKLYLRNKGVSPLENTFFHLLAQKKILFHKLPKFAYDYFKTINKKNTTNEEKLKFLKTMLQVMGWGIVDIIMKSNKNITLQIKHPPHGFQIEKDDWSFIARIIQGYLWTVNKKFKIDNMQFRNKTLIINYKI